MNKVIGECNKCGSNIHDVWYERFVGFKMELKSDCQIENKVFSDDYKYNHPAVNKDSTSQKMILNCSVNEEYKLCGKCNDKLLRIIGRFISKKI